MKKFTAILVMMAMLSSFVSCGNDTADEIESSVTSVSEDSEEETTEESSEPETVEVEEEPTEETTEEITEPETEEISKTSVEGSEEYAEVIESFLKCKNKDSDNVIDLCFPDKYFDTVKILYKTNLFSLYGIMGATRSIDFELISIDSVEPVSEEYIPYFNAYYGGFQPVYEYIEKNGTENPDIDKLSELMSTPINEPIGICFNIEKAVTVNCTISRYFHDGTESDYDFYEHDFKEIMEDEEYTLYYIDGEGWKVDCMTMGHLYEAERTMVLDELKSLYSASETVLSELEETCTEIPENCIICSDSSRNYNVSEEFLNTFDSTLDGCYQKKDGFDYFVMINDGELACVAGQYATKPKFYRAYPTEYFYDEDDYVIESYDERYNLCLDRMKNGQPQSYMKH
ncbi:MAG: hypothetical protein NC205_05465 [Prevotella sp.]|nr:hypothetical protein [Alistipes senegalensis]MCM1358023.1 hypothetical protein [Prevotella sp.]MCM1473270.1 hypothetical protein [Muribaculaceae bacterium]